MAGEANRFFCYLFTDSADLKEDASRFDHGHPVIDRAFTTTHAGLGWLGSNRLIGKDTNPDFAATFHVAGHRNTCRFYLARLHPAGFEGLQAELAEGERVSTGGLPLHAPSV